MISTSDFKKGARVQLDGQPYVILDVTSQSPSARGGATLVKAKLRNLISGQFVAKTFKSGEKFSEPDLEMRNGQYLYRDDSHFVFMDAETYEQYHLTEDEVSDVMGFITDGLEVRIQLFNDRPVGIEVPTTLVLEITDCEPAVRGDTVNAVTKAATLETGLVVAVPMFVEQGEKVRVDTREGGRYLERFKG